MIAPENPKRMAVAQYGPYTVWHDPLEHRPYGLFRIYRGERYIGAQLSFPCQSDAEWMERTAGVYAARRAAAAAYVKLRGAVKRGRPRKQSFQELAQAA